VIAVIGWAIFTTETRRHGGIAKIARIAKIAGIAKIGKKNLPRIYADQRGLGKQKPLKRRETVEAEE
jgi:hypothetical protein